MIEKDLVTAAEIISRGGVVIIPTDTIYGFSCDPRNAEAVNRIKELKKRDGKPFLIIESSLLRLKSDYFFDDVFNKKIINVLIKEGLWPGKITLLAKKNPNIKYSFLENFSKLGVRYTDNEIVNYICSVIDCGLASTSINITGEPYLNDIDEIISQWSGKVDYILNYGKISEASESTIIESESATKTIRFVRNPDEEIKVLILKAFSGYDIICH